MSYSQGDKFTALLDINLLGVVVNENETIEIKHVLKGVKAYHLDLEKDSMPIEIEFEFFESLVRDGVLKPYGTVTGSKAANTSYTKKPKNNDGRTTCFWCGAPTKDVPGVFMNTYTICTKCGK